MKNRDQYLQRFVITTLSPVGGLQVAVGQKDRHSGRHRIERC